MDKFLDRLLGAPVFQQGGSWLQYQINLISTMVLIGILIDWYQKRRGCWVVGMPEWDERLIYMTNCFTMLLGRIVTHDETHE